ncbi:hypothetical protein [Enhygromyxa salina]|uniref:hypothetical protein n=1 Tax=Enhygromyxa salina TaxID=215803 RepID=UPI000D08E500|nr:hypothetical protein [Enhygromyxa salina]
MIHSPEHFGEVARLPPDAGFLRLRVIERRDGWLIARPSPTELSLRHVDVELALADSSLHPAAKQWTRRRYDDGTEIEIARGAPLRAIGDQRYELIVDGVGLALDFDEDPTTLYFHPSSRRRARKPDQRVDWDWSGPGELLVGPQALHAAGPALVATFELNDRRARLVAFERHEARIIARVAPTGRVPDPAVGAAELELGWESIESGTTLYWPGGAFAGHVRHTIDVRPSASSGSAAGLSCYAIAPLELCTDPSPESAGRPAGSTTE